MKAMQITLLKTCDSRFFSHSICQDEEREEEKICGILKCIENIDFNMKSEPKTHLNGHCNDYLPRNAPTRQQNEDFRACIPKAIIV